MLSAHLEQWTVGPSVGAHGPTMIVEGLATVAISIKARSEGFCGRIPEDAPEYHSQGGARSLGFL
jgi:hypothetical protein